MILGARVKQVRELLSLTQSELANRLDVTQSFVAQVETNWAKAPDDFVTKLIFNTKFPKDFFERPPDDGFSLGSLYFARMQTCRIASRRPSIATRR